MGFLCSFNQIEGNYNDKEELRKAVEDTTNKLFPVELISSNCFTISEVLQSHKPWEYNKEDAGFDYVILDKDDIHVIILALKLKLMENIEIETNCNNEDSNISHTNANITNTILKLKRLLREMKNDESKTIYFEGSC